MKFWIWRAWNAARDRICDSGWVRAKSKELAVKQAWQCIGGPHMRDIKNIEVAEIPVDEPTVSMAAN